VFHTDDEETPDEEAAGTESEAQAAEQPRSEILNRDDIFDN
jgi:hypothetical protein